MEPICQNTPVTMLRKKNKFDAVVQGVTIPLESLTLNQCGAHLLNKGGNHRSSSTSFNNAAQLSSKKENSASGPARKSCVVKIGKKAMR